MDADVTDREKGVRSWFWVGDDSGLCCRTFIGVWAEDNGTGEGDSGWTPRFRRQDVGKRPTGKGFLR